MLINFAFMLTALLACCGLVLDVGLMELKQIKLQNAADAAAVGSAEELERGSSQATWTLAGKADASLNGFVDGQNNTTVILSNPPVSGSYVNSTQAIQATITQAYSAMFFPNVIQLSAKAVALGGSEPCAYFLSRVAAAPSLTLSGSLLNSSCTIYMGSSLSVNSSTASSTAQYRVVGSSGASIIPAGQVSPLPIFNSSSTVDPLLNVSSPVLASCTHSGGTSYVGNVTIYPGTYCGGLSLGTSGGTGNFKMSPGLYIVSGGMNIINAVVSGSGVTIFLTQGGGAGYGAMSVSQSEFYVSAPLNSANGGIQDVLVFADRNWSTGVTAVSFNGSEFQGDGVFYLPKTGLAVRGSELYAKNYMGVVADSGSVSNSQVSFKNNFTAGLTADPYAGNVSLVQ